MSIYDEIAKIDFSTIETKMVAVQHARSVGKSAMLGALYGGAKTGRFPPKPDPNWVARRVACPVCKAPKGEPCLDLSRWPRRNAGNKRKPYLWKAHEARVSRAALICEELT